MLTVLLAVWSWSFDRVEPPYAVMIAAQGLEVDVLISTLPRGARPGDMLLTPWGPVLGDREAERAALHDRLSKIVAEPAGADFSL